MKDYESKERYEEIELTPEQLRALVSELPEGVLLNVTWKGADERD